MATKNESYPKPKRYYVELHTKSKERVFANSLKDLRKRVYSIIRAEPVPFKFVNSYALIITSSRVIAPNTVEKDDIGSFRVLKNKDLYYENWKRNGYGKVKADGTIDSTKWVSAEDI